MDYTIRQNINLAIHYAIMAKIILFFEL